MCTDNRRTGALENVAHLDGEAGFECVDHDVSTYIDVAGGLDEIYRFVLRRSPGNAGNLIAEWVHRWPLLTPSNSKNTPDGIRVGRRRPTTMHP